MGWCPEDDYDFDDNSVDYEEDDDDDNDATEKATLHHLGRGCPWMHGDRIISGKQPA